MGDKAIDLLTLYFENVEKSKQLKQDRRERSGTMCAVLDWRDDEFTPTTCIDDMMCGRIKESELCDGCKKMHAVHLEIKRLGYERGGIMRSMRALFYKKDN